MTLANKIWSLALLALLAAASAAHAQDVKVRGRVVTADGSPIPGVAVQAFRQGEASQSVKSDASGEYAVGLAAGPPITRIEYSHSGFDLASIVFVSGTDPQQRIVKVMFERGQSRSVGAIADTVAAYEQFGLDAYMAATADRERLAGVSKELEFAPKLSNLPIKSGNDFVDDFLEERRKGVMNLLERL